MILMSRIFCLLVWLIVGGYTVYDLKKDNNNAWLLYLLIWLSYIISQITLITEKIAYVARI